MQEVTKGRHGIWLALLAIVVIGAFAWWNQGGTELTITGKATVKAAPDEYVFYPSYQVKDVSQDIAKQKVTETGNSVITKLKELGVTDSQLTTSVTENQNYDYRLMPTPEKPNPVDGYMASYSMTITVNDLAIAKKIQEYLASTPVSGSISPTSAFSDATQRKLEREARKQALEDAKQLADDTAETLSVSIRGIKSIGEPTWGGPVPFATALKAEGARDIAIQSAPSPELLVGEQEVTYQIQVVYRVR